MDMVSTGPGQARGERAPICPRCEAAAVEGEALAMCTGREPPLTVVSGLLSWGLERESAGQNCAAREVVLQASCAL